MASPRAVSACDTSSSSIEHSANSINSDASFEGVSSMAAAAPPSTPGDPTPRGEADMAIRLLGLCAPLRRSGPMSDDHDEGRTRSEADETDPLATAAATVGDAAGAFRGECPSVEAERLALTQTSALMSSSVSPPVAAMPWAPLMVSGVEVAVLMLLWCFSVAHSLASACKVTFPDAKASIPARCDCVRCSTLKSRAASCRTSFSQASTRSKKTALRLLPRDSVCRRGSVSGAIASRRACRFLLPLTRFRIASSALSRTAAV
mmetsp:Transcript_35455/g.106765  ORF Transcript_35455/g.106765 Transcript_35455/m.106765 type:complete len:262 (-) Transcript_35455:212-997(-)